jgi:hypothetical protein
MAVTPLIQIGIPAASAFFAKISRVPEQFA